MGIQEHFENRIKELEKNLVDVVPGLCGMFFLVYELPDGSMEENLGDSRNVLIGRMNLGVSKIYEKNAKVGYMCRRIGMLHYLDSKEVEYCINMPTEEVLKQRRDLRRKNRLNKKKFF